MRLETKGMIYSKGLQAGIEPGLALPGELPRRLIRCTSVKRNLPWACVRVKIKEQHQTNEVKSKYIY